MVPPDVAGLPPERRPRTLVDVRFFVDEDLLPVGQAMMWTRRDVVVCGSVLVDDELPRGQWDENWVPRVAGHGWIAITGNDEIRRNPHESAVAVEHKLRAICPHDVSGDLTMWQKLTLLTDHWDQIEAFVRRHPIGPWWLSVTASGPRELACRSMSCE